MSTVTVSPKFQVVIPKEIREQLALEPGQKMAVMTHQGRIELIPLGPIEDMMGFAKGIDEPFEREEERF